MNKKGKLVSEKIGGFLTFLTILMLVLLPIVVVGGQAYVAKYNTEVEKLRIKVNNQQKKNQSLNMKINELASLDSLESVAKSMGLAYNNDNIKNIGN